MALASYPQLMAQLAMELIVPDKALDHGQIHDIQSSTVFSSLRVNVAGLRTGNTNSLQDRGYIMGVRK